MVKKQVLSLSLTIHLTNLNREFSFTAKTAISDRLWWLCYTYIGMKRCRWKLPKSLSRRSAPSTYKDWISQRSGVSCRISWTPSDFGYNDMTA